MNRESLEGENRRDGLVRKSLISERRFLMSLIKWLFDSQILDYFTFVVSGRPVFFTIKPVLGEHLHLWLISRLFWGKGHMNVWRHSLISPRNPLLSPYPLYQPLCVWERDMISVVAHQELWPLILDLLISVTFSSTHWSHVSSDRSLDHIFPGVILACDEELLSCFPWFMLPCLFFRLQRDPAPPVTAVSRVSSLDFSLVLSQVTSNRL